MIGHVLMLDKPPLRCRGATYTPYKPPPFVCLCLSLFQFGFPSIFTCERLTVHIVVNKTVIPCYTEKMWLFELL